MATSAEPATPARAADPAERYDVAILGRHLAGGLLGAVLAAQGVRVLLVGSPEDRTEPAGETTVPYTAEVFLLLARRFGVPEIASFGLFRDLPAEVRASSGVKGSLGFLYHRPGRPQNPTETVQFHVPGEHGEWHPYRPVVDEYAAELAGRYGAALVPAGVTAADADADSTGGWVKADDGTTYRARYIVDCSGGSAPLVRRHGGHDPLPRMPHQSRVYAAHLTGVPPFEQVVPLVRRGRRSTRHSPWSLGTVHHIFDGGWLQVVSFDNHKESRNPSVGVTLSLDPDSSLAAELPDDPGLAFFTVVNRFPDLARQFGSATVVGDWQAVSRYQRTAAVTTGERWFALERSAGRTDMFLSRDVTMTAELVHALAAPLIRAVRTADYATAPFERVARFQADLTAYNDRLLAAARTACRDFRLWNAFTRVWLLWQILADLSLKRARLDAETDPRRDWSPVERFEDGGLWFPTPRGLPALLDRTLSNFDDVRLGLSKPHVAADRVFAELRRDPVVPPLYAFGDPSARVYRFTFPKRLRMLWWTKTSAPEDFRRLLTRDNVTSVTSGSSR